MCSSLSGILVYFHYHDYFFFFVSLEDQLDLEEEN